VKKFRTIKGGRTGLVKIQSKTIRKGYKKNKGKYNYVQHLMPFPIGQNENLKPFLKQELRFKMNIKGDTLYVELKKQKDKTEEQHEDN
jgi:hypothetical protein